jgi:hypothetical protein
MYIKVESNEKKKVLNTIEDLMDLESGTNISLKKKNDFYIVEISNNREEPDVI